MSADQPRPYRLLPDFAAPTTHALASALLRRSDVRVRSLTWGRLVVIWDTKPPAPSDHSVASDGDSTKRPSLTVGQHVRGSWDCAVIVAQEGAKSQVKWCDRDGRTWRDNYTITPAPPCANDHEESPEH